MGVGWKLVEMGRMLIAQVNMEAQSLKQSSEAQVERVSPGRKHPVGGLPPRLIEASVGYAF